MFSLSLTHCFYVTVDTHSHNANLFIFFSFYVTLKTVIARRSDMLVMSTEGPLGAYVNSHGFVHEVMTLYKANGMALVGYAEKEYSWFPG